MKKFSNKTLILIVSIILLAVNSGLIFSYYNFYLSDRITTDLVEAKDKNHKSINIIVKSIEGKPLDEAIELIELYVKNNGGYISLKDSSGKIVYANKKDFAKIFSSTVLINIDDSEYELTYSEISVMPGIKLIRNFMFYEIIVVSIIVLVSFYISSKTVINPIDTITKDINDYKFGKRPFKRKMPKGVERIQNAFVDMVDSLELEKENQNQIIASISHDIKTPLTSVMGYADRLKNKELSEDKKQLYIEKIYTKAVMMKEILEEFDDYQSCNIKETLKKEKIAVKDICNYIVKDFDDELKDKKIKLIINNSCKTENINVDLIKIKRVFSNIITNSVNHFNGKDGIIRINVTRKDKMVMFDVGDNGGGISSEKDLKRIFEPLYTTDPSRKISGLGLSICKQIIGTHSGNIYAKNNDINGLSIIFILPLDLSK